VDARKLVRKSLEFDGPVRVPRQLWLLPWAEARYAEHAAYLRRNFPDDLVTAPRPCMTFIVPAPISYCWNQTLHKPFLMSMR
jgi:hypothetical protein